MTVERRNKNEWVVVIITNDGDFFCSGPFESEEEAKAVEDKMRIFFSNKKKIKKILVKEVIEKSEIQKLVSRHSGITRW